MENRVLVRLPIADALRETGLTVIEAGSADEGLAYLGTGEMVDAVFSDFQMPGQVDGLQLTRHLRQAMPTIPVILTSGRFEATKVHDVARLIQKPYSLAQVVKTFLLLLLERRDPTVSIMIYSVLPIEAEIVVRHALPEFLRQCCFWDWRQSTSKKLRKF